MELTRHCATWAKFSRESPPMYRWMLWWKPIKVTRLWWEPIKVARLWWEPRQLTREVRNHRGGWETYSENSSESDGPEWPEWPVQQHPTGSLLHRGVLLQQSRSVTAVNTSNHSEVQLPHPADLIRHLGPSPDPSPSRPCRGCGEHSCDQYPTCVRAMFADLLGQPPCKFWRAE